MMASVNDMVQQYTDMRQNLKRLEIELETKWHKDELDEGDRFLEVMTRHQMAASERFEELETLYVNMDIKWKDVMMYYGENPKSMRPDDFFGIFAKFVADWKVGYLQKDKGSVRQYVMLLVYKKQDAVIAEEKYIQKKEREAKRQEQARKEQRLRDDIHQQTASFELDGDDRRMMDNLLEKLRSGETENRQRRERRQHQRRLMFAQPTALVDPSSTPDLELSAQNLLKSLQAE